MAYDGVMVIGVDPAQQGGEWTATLPIDDLVLAKRPEHRCCSWCRPPIHIVCVHVIGAISEAGLRSGFESFAAENRREGLQMGEPVELARPDGCDGGDGWGVVRHFIQPLGPLTEEGDGVRD